jgi:hypothetical protein
MSESSRAQFAAMLRAVADVVEHDETVRIPEASVTFWTSGAEDQAAALQMIAGAIPVQWSGEISRSGRRDWYDLTASTEGASSLSGLTVTVHAYASAVCAETGTRTVTEWAPLPAVAALTGRRDGGAA